MRLLATLLAACALSAASLSAAQPARQLTMQSSWPRALTLHESFEFFAERVRKLSGGALTIRTHGAGEIVPAFEVLEAVHGRRVDGAQTFAAYWTGKHKAAILFAGPPGGPFGMDHLDYLAWLYDGGGIELWNELYQRHLRLDLVVFPAFGYGPQPLGWFKTPLRNLEDFKRARCRQTGIVAEIYRRLGQSFVNMPGAQIVPALERGVIDCAEWVGGVEDMRIGLHTAARYYYAPGVVEMTTIGELVLNGALWRSLREQEKAWIGSASLETFARYWAKWAKDDAQAYDEMVRHHAVQLLRSPPDILIAAMKVWDQMAADEAARDPFFARVLESQRRFAGTLVPANRVARLPYSFVANYYWPPQ